MKLTRASELDFVPASHESATDPGVLKKVLMTKDALAAGQVQMVNWSLLKVGKQFCPHYHQDMQEVFMVVSGVAEMLVWPAGENTNKVPAAQPTIVQLTEGDTVLVEPNEVHVMKNIGDQDVQYIVFGVSTGQGGQTVNVDWETA